MKTVTRTVLTILAIYVLLYITITRISLNLNRQIGLSSIYFVPFSALNMDSRLKDRMHGFGCWFFFPAWLIDRHIFGGPDVASTPLLHLEASDERAVISTFPSTNRHKDATSE